MIIFYLMWDQENTVQLINLFILQLWGVFHIIIVILSVYSNNVSVSVCFKIHFMRHCTNNPVNMAKLRCLNFSPALTATLCVSICGGKKVSKITLTVELICARSNFFETKLSIYFGPYYLTMQYEKRYETFSLDSLILYSNVCEIATMGTKLTYFHWGPHERYGGPQKVSCN